MTPARFRKLKLTLMSRQHDLTVLADGVHKDHNISAIVRTSEAVGIACLHAVAYTGEFRRNHAISGGAGRWIGLVEHRTTAGACRTLRSQGMQIVLAHAGAGAVDFREIDYTRPTAIVLGAESKGPSDAAVRNADQAIAIPMHGFVESLNVSVAAAVILYEAERQRAAAGAYSRPPDEDESFWETLFEWAYPEVAKRCRELELPYPKLDADGAMIRNPFESL